MKSFSKFFNEAKINPPTYDAVGFVESYKTIKIDYSYHYKDERYGLRHGTIEMNNHLIMKAIDIKVVDGRNKFLPTRDYNIKSKKYQRAMAVSINFLRTTMTVMTLLEQGKDRLFDGDIILTVEQKEPIIIINVE